MGWLDSFAPASLIRILRIKHVLSRRPLTHSLTSARSLLLLQPWFYEDIGCDLWVTWLWPSPANFACSMPMSLPPSCKCTPGYVAIVGKMSWLTKLFVCPRSQKRNDFSLLTILLRWSSSCWGWRCAAACSSWGCRAPRCSRRGKPRSLKWRKINFTATIVVCFY